MDPYLFLLLFLSLSASVVLAVAQPTSHITVTGSVFCDICYNNSFTKHSYFLPGVDVHVQCKFQANAPRTTEQITFSVNRTTNRYGVYKLDIPSVEGVDCVEGPAIQSVCQASLIGSSAPGCNVPGISTTSKEIMLKSRSTNLCVYSISALSYRPSQRNSTLCGDYHNKEELSDSFNSSKFFLPYFPWPLPQLPPFPSFPPLPPFPPFQFPLLPPFPSAPPQPPSLPYPFPNVPPLPTPPVFNLGDPRTWRPNIPSSNPPLQPPLNPRTWIPENPFLSPPPPGFNLTDPRTWIPNFPPSPPNSPQIQQP